MYKSIAFIDERGIIKKLFSIWYILESAWFTVTSFTTKNEAITMSIFKRLSATLVSRIDQVVGEIENHDAVIQASLNDMCKKVAEAKVRLGRVRREEERLNQQIREHRQNEERWHKRAVASAKDDEAKALECVRRARHCRQHAEKLAQVQAGYEQTADKLAHDIEASEQRLAETKHKLTLMRARQSTSAAVNATCKPESGTDQFLDETFDRWEVNISQTEMTVEHHDIVDPVEREFITQEQQEELRNELAELLAREEEK